MSPISAKQVKSSMDQWLSKANQPFHREIQCPSFLWGEGSFQHVLIRG